MWMELIKHMLKLSTNMEKCESSIAVNYVCMLLFFVQIIVFMDRLIYMYCNSNGHCQGNDSDNE